MALDRYRRLLVMRVCVCMSIGIESFMFKMAIQSMASQFQTLGITNGDDVRL